MIKKNRRIQNAGTLRESCAEVTSETTRVTTAIFNLLCDEGCPLSIITFVARDSVHYEEQSWRNERPTHAKPWCYRISRFILLVTKYPRRPVDRKECSTLTVRARNYTRVSNCVSHINNAPAVLNSSFPVLLVSEDPGTRHLRPSLRLS